MSFRRQEMDDSVTKQDQIYIEMSNTDNGKITSTVRWVPSFKIREYPKECVVEYPVDGCTPTSCNLRDKHQCVHFGQFLYDLITGYNMSVYSGGSWKFKLVINFQEPP